MAWRDQLRQATFRGVPFAVRDAGMSGGRRTVPHEYPDRDTPFVEDLGRGIRRFPIDAFVIGADYMEARDALLEALEAGGEGELVHPYLGARSVSVETFELREGAGEGGLARFSISFVESGQELHPSSDRDFLASVDAQAAELTESAEAGFLERFSVAGLPAFVAGAAEGLIDDLAGTFDQVAGPLLAGVEGAAAFARDISALGANAANLVQMPGNLAARITSLLSGLSSASGGRHRQTTAALLTLGQWGQNKPTVPRTTSTRAQQSDNQAALVDLVTQVATAQAVKEAARTAWVTHDDAVQARQTLADRLDDVMQGANSDTLYLDAQALRAELVQAVPAPDQSLPRLSSFTPKTTLPALVVAYQVHGDASRADEIATRNRIRHPGFVPGGNPLEILNRG